MATSQHDVVELHDCLDDPVMGAIGFLNEVMARHPDAISFAPGAPNPVFVDAFDHERHLQRYLRHVTEHASVGPGRVKRLLFEYGPSRGIVNDLIAAAFAVDHGVAVDERATVVTVGAQEAMLLVLRALVRAGERIAVVTPCFPGIVGAARLLEIEPVAVPETPDGPCLDRLRAECARATDAGTRLRACYVAPDHANPSGTRMPLSARHALLELAREMDLILIEDNAYGFTADESTRLPPLKALDTDARVVHVGTFAKIGVPGIRIGFVIADQPVRGGRLLADELAVLKSMVTVNTPPLCQAVVGGLLLEHGTSLRELGRRKGAYYRHNLSLLVDALDRHLPVRPGLSWQRPSGGFFVRVTLAVPVDLALLEVSAARYGVIWTPMSTFHLDAAGDHTLRLSCSYLDGAQIETGAARLAAFVREQA